MGIIILIKNIYYKVNAIIFKSKICIIIILYIIPFRMSHLSSYLLILTKIAKSLSKIKEKLPLLIFVKFGITFIFIGSKTTHKQWK